MSVKAPHLPTQSLLTLSRDSATTIVFITDAGRGDRVISGICNFRVCVCPRSLSKKARVINTKFGTRIPCGHGLTLMSKGQQGHTVMEFAAGVSMHVDFRF